MLVDPMGKKSPAAAKHVHFSTEPSQYYSNTVEYTLEELTVDCWYNTEEIKNFRKTGMELALHVLEVERLNRARFSYQRVFERTLEACRQVKSEEDVNCSVLETSEMEHLQRWLDVADCRLGLERVSILLLARDKTVRRCALQRLIRDEQRRPHHGNSSPAHVWIDGSTEPWNRAEFLRHECARYSRPSRVWARTMAEALADVVRNGNSKGFSDRLVTDVTMPSLGIEV